MTTVVAPQHAASVEAGEGENDTSTAPDSTTTAQAEVKDTTTTTAVDSNNDTSTQDEVSKIVESNVAYRQLMQQRVAAMFAEHGDSYLQKRLQEEIAAVKKKVAELTALKKRIAATSRNISALLETKRKNAMLKEKTEITCHGLQDTLKQRKELMGQIASEMACHRAETQARVEEKLKESEADIETRTAALAELQRENETLAAQVAEKKAAFDAARANLQSTIQGRVSAAETLFKQLSTTTKELEELEDRLVATRRTRQTALSETAMLEEQLKVYEERYNGFASSAMKPEEVAELAARQRTQAEARIAALEKEKAEANQMRLTFDSETVELRAKTAALKRELQQAEKAKVAAEKRCRLAQQKVHGK